MLYSILNNIDLFLDSILNDRTNAIITLMTLFIGILSYLRIRQTRIKISQDISRINSLVNLPEILFLIQQARKNILPHEKSALKNLISMETRIESFLDFAAGIQVFNCHPLIRAAKYCRDNGEAWKAVVFYKKAIQYEEEYDNNLMKHDELDECFNGLQKCHLALWDLEEAINVIAIARKFNIAIYIEESKIRRWSFLLCIQESARFYLRGLISIVNGNRKRSPRIASTKNSVMPI